MHELGVFAYITIKIKLFVSTVELEEVKLDGLALKEKTNDI